MNLNEQQLIDLALRYYPHEYDEDDPNFESSPERRAYYAAWDRAPSFEHWFKVVEAIRKDLGGLSVYDATQGRGRPSFRCVARVKEQSLVAGAQLETLVVGLRSALAPIYGVAWVQRILAPQPVKERPWHGFSVEIPEELASIADVVGRHIEQESGFQRLSAELARVRVPLIFVDSVFYGEATLFDALLDYDPANVP